MGLVVESGSGATNSNSYVSVDFADTYHSDRGNTSWASLSTDSKTAALIKAGDYLNSMYFKGIRYSANQAMEFPREGLVDRDGYELSKSAIPTQLKFAQCEAALRESVSSGVLQPDLERGGAVKRKKIDVIETEWFDSATDSTTFTYVQGLLRKFLASSNVRTIVRS